MPSLSPNGLVTSQNFTTTTSRRPNGFANFAPSPTMAFVPTRLQIGRSFETFFFWMTRRFLQAGSDKIPNFVLLHQRAALSDKATGQWGLAGDRWGELPVVWRLARRELLLPNLALGIVRYTILTVYFNWWVNLIWIQQYVFNFLSQAFGLNMEKISSQIQFSQAIFKNLWKTAFHH